MKHSFRKYEDCAHAWANEHSTHGEVYSPPGAPTRMYFEQHNDTIYSYGSHFPIATRIKDDKKGNIILFTTDTYSNTTSKQVGIVRDAIPDWYEVILVPKPHAAWHTYSYARDNVYSMLTSLYEYLQKQKRARKNDYTFEIAELVKNIKRYIEYFRIKGKMLKQVRDKARNNHTTHLYKLLRSIYGGEMNDLIEEFSAIAEKRKAKLREENKVKIEEWLEGKDRFLSGLGRDYLRIKDGQIETSQGVKVGLPEAKALYNVIRLVQKGIVPPGDSREVARSIKDKFGDKYSEVVNGGLKIAGWGVQRIMSDGRFIAGCHKIFPAEVDRVATQLNWK